MLRLPIQRLLCIPLWCLAAKTYCSDFDQNLFNLTLDELVDIPVSIANRSSTQLSQTPSSVTVFTRDQLRQMGIYTLEHLLNYVPGVQTARTQQDGVIQTPIFRGRGNQHGSSPNVLLMLDGRRLNSPVTGGAFDLPLNNLDWIEQIEIIRGPGSALYGANAFNGVINIVTRIEAGTVSARVGELDTNSGAVQLKQAIGDAQLGVYLAGYRDEGETYSPFYTFFDETYKTNDPFKRNTVASSLSYRNLSVDTYYTRAQLDNFVQGSILSNGNNRYETTLNSFRIGYSALHGENWNLNLNSEYMDFTGDFFIGLMPAKVASEIWWSDASERVPIGGNHLEWQYTLFSVDGKYTGTSRHILSYGAEYRYEEVAPNPFHGNWDQQVMEASRGTRILPCDCINRGFWYRGERADFLPESQRSIENVWIQDQWQLTKELALTLGTRYDYYDDVGGHPSFRGSLVYNFLTNTQFKLIVGDAFRAPTISETRALIASNFVGNPNLEPETIKTVDAVWQQQWQAVNISTTWSHSTIKNSISLEPQNEEYQPGVIAFQPVNRNSLELQSLEFELNARIATSWLVRAGATHFIEFEKTGTAQNLAFAILNFNSTNGINANLNAYYHSHVLSRMKNNNEFDQDIYLDDFWNITFNLSYALSPGFEIFTTIENLGNESFRTYTTANNGLEYGIPSRGRVTTLGVRWRFSEARN